MKWFILLVFIQCVISIFYSECAPTNDECTLTCSNFIPMILKSFFRSFQHTQNFCLLLRKYVLFMNGVTTVQIQSAYLLQKIKTIGETEFSIVEISDTDAKSVAIIAFTASKIDVIFMEDAKIILSWRKNIATEMMLLFWMNLDAVTFHDMIRRCQKEDLDKQWTQNRILELSNWEKFIAESKNQREKYGSGFIYVRQISSTMNVFSVESSRKTIVFSSQQYGLADINLRSVCVILRNSQNEHSFVLIFVTPKGKESFNQIALTHADIQLSKMTRERAQIISAIDADNTT